MDSLWGNIFHTKKRRKEHVLGVLKNIPMFSDLSIRELATIQRIDTMFLQAVPQ